MPELFNRDGSTWARLNGKEVRLEPNHKDRHRRRWWRARDGATDEVLTDWVMNQNRAASLGLAR